MFCFQRPPQCVVPSTPCSRQDHCFQIPEVKLDVEGGDGGGQGRSIKVSPKQSKAGQTGANMTPTKSSQGPTHATETAHWHKTRQRVAETNSNALWPKKGVSKTAPKGPRTMLHGSNSRTPSEHPNLHLPQKGIPLVLTHGQFGSIDHAGWDVGFLRSLTSAPRPKRGEAPEPIRAALRPGTHSGPS